MLAVRERIPDDEHLVAELEGSGHSDSMTTSRRGFLGALAGGLAATFALDLEKALWVPGKKLVSIPKPRPRNAHYMGVDMVMPSGWSGLRKDIEMLKGRLQANIEEVCNREMLRPQYADLVIPDGLQLVERRVDRDSGFKWRAMVNYDISHAEQVLRVDAMFRA